MDGLNIFEDVIGQKKMTSLTVVKWWTSVKVRFSTTLTSGFLFSRLGASISASRHKFPNKEYNIKRKPLGPGYSFEELSADSYPWKFDVLKTDIC